MNDSYFAGLFDGEGCLRIGFNGAQYQLLASLGMTDRRPVDGMKERFGGWVELRPNDGTVWKPVYIWRASSKGVVALLDGVEDELIVKREHAKCAREFQLLLALRSPRLDPRKTVFFERMKELNKRGR